MKPSKSVAAATNWLRSDFFNGNTFAAIIRSAIGSVNELSPSDSYILRNVVGHIVAGTSTPEEDLQFKKLLEKIV